MLQKITRTEVDHEEVLQKIIRGEVDHERCYSRSSGARWIMIGAAEDHHGRGGS